MHQQQPAFENIVGKGEIALKEQFVYIFDTISLFAAELEEPKIGIWGKGLTNKFFNNSLGSLDS